MTPVQPIQQSAIEDLRNAIFMAESWAEDINLTPDQAGAFRDTARLVRHALEQLGEPNLAAVQAAEILVREYHGSLDEQRNARDVAAGILHSQLTGIVPKTWRA